MIDFFRNLKELLRFLQLNKNDQRLVFYSEGRNYWVHLEGLVNQLLSDTNLQVCYISSGDNDPGLELDRPNLHQFKIKEGFILNYLFENIAADVMVMTTPDLNNFQLVRSKFPVHYIYIQHSLVSLHMAYNQGAFDHFDSIFCSGHHHLKEVKVLAPDKNAVEHGYGRVDAIIAESKRVKVLKQASKPLHVLLAPSWGEFGIIETMGLQVVKKLMDSGFKVTLRPHPQTIKFAKKQVEEITNRYSGEERFCFEASVDGQNSLHNSDVMISDWSGAALDYAFGLGKPVIYIDVPRKVNNKHYEDIPIEPFEVAIRSEIGTIVPINEVDRIAEFVESCHIRENIAEEYLYNISRSDEVGAEHISRLLNDK